MAYHDRPTAALSIASAIIAMSFWALGVLHVRHDELVHGELRLLEPRERIVRGRVEILVR